MKIFKSKDGFWNLNKISSITFAHFQKIYKGYVDNKKIKNIPEADVKKLYDDLKSEYEKAVAEYEKALKEAEKVS